MSQVQVDQNNYQMPPQDGFTIAHFLAVSDIDRSARFYETVFGCRILSRGDSSGAPGYIQIANTWLIVNVGGGPTPDKPRREPHSLLGQPRLAQAFVNGLDLGQIGRVVAHRCPPGAGAEDGEGGVESETGFYSGTRLVKSTKLREGRAQNTMRKRIISVGLDRPSKPSDRLVKGAEEVLRNAGASHPDIS
jgi:catechol 2,3-dioxygenase-like lactoylglutathione lyase family enzyme